MILQVLRPKTCRRSNCFRESSVIEYGYATNLAIDHEPENILNAVERQNASFASLPHALPVCMAILDRRTDLADELWVCHSDLQVRILLIPLKSVQILPHDHLYHMYCGLMLAYLRIEENLETFAVMRTERDWSSDIQVVKKVGDVKHHGMATL